MFFQKAENLFVKTSEKRDNFMIPAFVYYDKNL